MRSHHAEVKSRRTVCRLVLLGALVSGLAACQPPQPVAYQPPPPMGYEPGPVASAPTPMFERSIVLTVNFGFNSYRIRPDSYAVLDSVAAAMLDQRLAGSHFEVNGHTDVSGRLGYNISLSTQRAYAVVEYLASRGVPRQLMRPQGFGPLQLFDPYNPRSPANRRVEIVALRP